MKKIISMMTVLLLLGSLAFAQDATGYPEGLKIGDPAPDLSGIDQGGKKFDLDMALKSGDVVVVFYRGQWCPYCRKQLSQYQDSLRFVMEKGASLVAITPETPENVNGTVEKTGSSFPIIQDKGLAIMKAYKVDFTVDEKTMKRYKGYGIDLEKANGDNGANLPVPATYIIGQDKRIKFVFFNTDYKKRASIQDILDNLR